MAASAAATAYLQLVPKLASGSKQTIKSELESIDGGGAGSTVGTGFGSGLKTAAVTAAVAAGTAIAAALVSVTKSSIEAYADYEQLVGGVETLFKDSASVIQEYASTAYKTAGISANQYMEQATSFSASLIQSLGGDTAAAAEYANTAIIDMSDNANKMGTAIESIQNAYQGFAKQNYTMLDNLKLGYGGTKSEMERLIADANKLKEANGEMADLTIENYSDIIEAIHLVQEEMGITGTTALEATETITGSVGMVKSAWADLLAGLANENANVGLLAQQLMDSLMTAANNIVPRIVQVIDSIVALLPTLLPQIINSAIQLFGGFITGMSEVVTKLIASLPEIIVNVANALIANIPTLITAAFTLFTALLTGLVEATPQLIEMLPQLIDQVCTTLIELMPLILQSAIMLFLAFVEAITLAAPQIIAALVNFIRTLPERIREHKDQFKQAGMDLLEGLKEGIKAKAQSIIDSIRGTVQNAIDAAKRLLGINSPSRVFRAIGEGTMEGFVLGVNRSAKTAADATKKAMEGVQTAASLNSNINVNGNGLSGKVFNITMDVKADNVHSFDNFISIIERASAQYA